MKGHRNENRAGERETSDELCVGITSQDETEVQPSASLARLFDLSESCERDEKIDKASKKEARSKKEKGRKSSIFNSRASTI